MVGSNYSRRAAGSRTDGAGRLCARSGTSTAPSAGRSCKNRLWFFATAREEGSERGVPACSRTRTPAIRPSSPTSPTRRGRRSSRRPTASTPARLTIAGDPEQQGEPLLGRAAAVRRRRRAQGYTGQRLPHVAGTDLIYAGSTAAPTPSASATAAPETAAYRDYGSPRASGEVDRRPVTNHLLLEAAKAPTRAGRAASRSPASPTADLVRITEQCAASCVDQRRHPGPDVPVAQLVLERELEHAVERGASYVTGRPEHQVRLPGGATCMTTGRSVGAPITRSPADVPDQQRRAGPDDRDHLGSIPCTAAGPVRRVLCPGPVDAGPPHGAGRAALRPRLELLSRADRRSGPLLADERDVFPQTTGRDGLSRPLAARRRRLRPVRQRERRRSSSTSAAISRPPRTAGCSRR